MKPLFYLLFFLSLSTQAQTTPGQYPQASEKILKITDIEEMDESELKLMRNEIFARYGYIFKSVELNAHFTSQPWYKPVSADVNNRLTDIEKKNTTLIKRQEQRIRTTGEFEDFYALFKQALEKEDVEKLVDLAHLDLMVSEARVREGFYSVWDKVIAAARDREIPNAQDNSAVLVYDERNDGTTVDYVEFKKIGKCWYITGFGGAG
jgi:YARHG domain